MTVTPRGVSDAASCLTMALALRAGQVETPRSRF
jgi:hypothetical protein